MSEDPPIPISTFRADALRVSVYRTRAEAGRAAADYVRMGIERFFLTSGTARIVFAAAPSQNEFLADLSSGNTVDWTRVVAFHMDEYLGLGANHASSFRSYLHHHIFKKTAISQDRLRLIPGERVERPARVCLDYEEVLRSDPPDIVCAGIGENGHLAFNDPPVADFADPVWVKVVRLDAECRAQQVNDGGFARLEDVPTHAYTLTIPALMSAAMISVVVLGHRKAPAVRAALRCAIDESCPASVLRRHAGAMLFLDSDAARDVIS